MDQENSKEVQQNELFSYYRYEGIIVQSIIASITTLLIICILVKYRKCKLDKIYYILLALFELIIILKIIPSFIEVYNKKKVLAVSIFNGVVVTASYTSILCLM